MRDPEDKKAFSDVLRATLEIYGKDSSIQVIQIWWAALLRFPIEDVRAGFSRYIQSTESGQFPPKPADIIRMIEGSAKTRGAMAWAKVMNAVSRVGYMTSVAFDDPVIHAVIEDMGGWFELCTSKESEQPFLAKDFERRYVAYTEQGGVNEYPAYLIGKAEAENSTRGYKTSPPVLVGDVQKAIQVKQGGSTAPRIAITHISDALLTAKLEAA